MNAPTEVATTTAEPSGGLLETLLLTGEKTLVGSGKDLYQQSSYSGGALWSVGSRAWAWLAAADFSDHGAKGTSSSNGKAWYIGRQIGSDDRVAREQVARDGLLVEWFPALRHSGPPVPKTTRVRLKVARLDRA